jgi:general secretion pathway protein D
VKSYTSKPWRKVISQALLVTLACMIFCSPHAQAQDPGSPPPGAPESSSEGEKDADDGLVAVNLKNVNVDALVKFLGEITGKAVMKHKDVKVAITVYSQEKVTPRNAFALLSDALLLEKIAIVEDRDTIKLIPIAMLSEVVVELLPADAEEALGGIIKNVIPIKFSDVKDIEELIKPLMSPAGRLVAHPTSRKIIITDTAKHVAAIRGIIAEVDMLDTHQRKVKVFELQHATAEEIAPLLKSVLMTMAAKSAGAPPPKPGQPRPPQPGQKGKTPPSGAGGELEVVAYKTANWVVVVASEEIIQAAIALVEEFDREKPEAVSLHFLPVLYSSPDEIARELDAVFSKGPDKRVKDIVEISADSRSNSLIILSSDENFAKIEEIVAKVDTEESVKMMTRTYELVHADASDIAEQMNELYQGLEENNRRSYWGYSSSRGQDEKTRFVPEPRTNSVIAIGRPTEFTKIEEMIKKLDQPIDADEVKPRIYRLKFIDATEVTEVLNDVFGAGDTESSGGYYSYWYGSNDDKSADIGRLYGKVNFVTVSSSNSIIVMTNNTQNFKIIGDFIEEIDQVSPDAANTIVINLQYAQATDLADKLNALYAKQGSRMPQQGQQKESEQQQSSRSSYYSWLYGSPKDKDDKRTISNLIGQVRVVPDQRTNSLIVTTAAQNFTLLRDLVEELDVESPKVLVSVRLLEITTTKSKRVGTRFSSDPAVFESDDFDNGLTTLFGISWQDIAHEGTIATSEGLDLGLLMQFLRHNADTRILSDTTIAMNNNEAAKIFVGAQVPFLTKKQSSPEGAGITQDFEYKDAGTTLDITPNINTVDRVEMKIKLEASQIRVGEVILGGQIIDTRQFETNIAIADGDTVVIGGIMRESESDAVRAVPILGKIPVANLIFRKKDKKHEITELIAFITPTILRSEDSATIATEEAMKKLPNINEWRPLEEEPKAPKRKGLFRRKSKQKRK